MSCDVMSTASPRDSVGFRRVLLLDLRLSSTKIFTARFVAKLYSRAGRSFPAHRRCSRRRSGVGTKFDHHLHPCRYRLCSAAPLYNTTCSILRISTRVRINAISRPLIITRTGFRRSRCNRRVERSSASYPDLRSNRNNLESEFWVLEIRSGIIALAMVANVMPLPPYPRANCAPGKSLWGPI
jgi:hypothetical protein